MRGMILYSIRSENLRIGRRCVGILQALSRKSILDVLETIYWIFWKTIVQKLTVVKLGVYDGVNACLCTIMCCGVITVCSSTDTRLATTVARNASYTDDTGFP